MNATEFEYRFGRTLSNCRPRRVSSWSSNELHHLSLSRELYVGVIAYYIRNFSLSLSNHSSLDTTSYELLVVDDKHQIRSRKLKIAFSYFVTVEEESRKYKEKHVRVNFIPGSEIAIVTRRAREIFAGSKSPDRFTCAFLACAREFHRNFTRPRFYRLSPSISRYANKSAGFEKVTHLCNRVYPTVIARGTPGFSVGEFRAPRSREEWHGSEWYSRYSARTRLDLDGMLSNARTSVTAHSTNIRFVISLRDYEYPLLWIL